MTLGADEQFHNFLFYLLCLHTIHNRLQQWGKSTYSLASRMWMWWGISQPKRCVKTVKKAGIQKSNVTQT